MVTDDNTPSGGRKVIYTLVDVLCELGWKAYALHQRKGFRYTWFPNNTPVTWTHGIRRARHRKRGIASLFKLRLHLIIERFSSTQNNEVQLSANDFLVIPENRVTHLDTIFPGVPKVVFNQGPYIFLRQFGLTDLPRTLHHPDIKAWWCVSELIVETMRALRVPQSVHLVPNFIDQKLFSLSPNKKKQIAYMPRKLSQDSDALINFLKIRGNLRDFEFIPIDGMPPESVSKILKESLIFLSFSHREGFGLPPVEALACGCTVVGYAGNAGKEYASNPNSYWIEEGDLVSFSAAVEEQITFFLSQPDQWLELSREGSERIQSRYNMSKTRKALSSAVECVFFS